MQMKALDKSPAKEPHQLVAFQVLTSACVDGQVCAFVVGRKQSSMLVIYVLATLIFIDPPDDIAM